MRKLLNTLFVTTENAYLTKEGENVLVNVENEVIGRYPLHILKSIISFSYAGASPSLMGECARRNIDLVFCTPKGSFLARVGSEFEGNVLLRREQYRIADNKERSSKVASGFIFGKIYNCRWCMERTMRDHSLRIDLPRMKEASQQLKNQLPEILNNVSLETLRGIEGSAAVTYFSVFDDMILANKNVFHFEGRNRRPPLDRINALLSFAYTLLANDCASSLESVGLDPYVGFMHQDRPGRSSLALDLMEELRPCIADRFVLTQVNNRVFNADDFQTHESGAVFLNDDARKVFLKKWQERKTEAIIHPYLKEKISWGLVPYVQALLLARYIRNDMDAYPPFLWK